MIIYKIRLWKRFFGAFNWFIIIWRSFLMRKRPFNNMTHHFSMKVCLINVGQSGVNIGESSWKQISRDNFVLPNGDSSSNIHPLYDISNRARLFTETKGGKFIPRNIFIDFDPDSVDGVLRRNPGFFDNDYLLKGNQDASNNFARGFYTLSNAFIDSALDKIRKVKEESDQNVNFLINESLSGGTGSGFSAHLSIRLKDEFPKMLKINNSLIPSENISDIIVEPYNCLLSIDRLFTESHVIYQNETLYEFCQNDLGIENPTYCDINYAISQVISSLASINDLNSLITNTTFNERCNILVPFLSNIRSPNRIIYNDLSAEIMLSKLRNFSELTSTLGGFIKYPTLAFKRDRLFDFYSLAFINKGINHFGFPHIINEIVEPKQFINYKKCFFIRNYPMKPIVDHEQHVGDVSHSSCALINIFTTQYTFKKIHKKFLSLYERKAFIHHYFAEGMEDIEFKSAEKGVKDIINHYKRFGENIVFYENHPFGFDKSVINLEEPKREEEDYEYYLIR